MLTVAVITGTALSGLSTNTRMAAQIHSAPTDQQAKDPSTPMTGERDRARARAMPPHYPRQDRAPAPPAL
eukprot:COSAG01_NODE_284_length_19459_cov_64.204494_6_plen_70_part_00